MENNPQITTVFVAGSTGFCGQAVVIALAKHPKYQPIAHIRPTSSRLESTKKKFEDVGAIVLCCDFEDLPQQLAEIKPRIMSSFIGTTKKQMKQYGGTYQEIDYDLNRQLIEIAKVHNSAFVYLSSMGVEWAKWNAYLYARYLVERDLQESNLSSAIIRPGILSGSRDHSRPTEEMGAWFSHRLTTVYQKLGLQKLADGTKPLDAPEVADFVVHLLEKTNLLEQKGVQQIYELSDINRILREG
jgi:nucleoside-diphosphate-sugar epimerase